MRTFISKEDLKVMHHIVLKQGDAISFEDNQEVVTLEKENAYKIELKLSDIEKNDMFIEQKDNISITVKDTTDEDDVVKPWTLQLVVNTTRRKLRLCEAAIREELNKILE